jgi:hypothetical protein
MVQFSLLLAVNLAALGLLFLYVRHRVNKALEMDGFMESLRKEVGELVRDLNQTTDRNITLVEDSIRSLKEASAEADRRVTVLKREAERRSTESTVYDRLGRLREGKPAPARSEGPALSLDFETEQPSARTAYVQSANERTAVEQSAAGSPATETHSAGKPEPARRAESISPDVVSGDTVPREEMSSVPFVSFSSSPIRPKPPVRDEVLSLSRQGISSELIAAKLGITVAEVELIVSLEEQKGLLFREEGK